MLYPTRDRTGFVELRRAERYLCPIPERSFLVPHPRYADRPPSNTLPEQFEGTLVNLSVHGCQLSLACVCEPKQHVAISLQIPGLQTPIEIPHAVIVWVQPARTGFQFLDLTLVLETQLIIATTILAEQQP